MPVRRLWFLMEGMLAVKGAAKNSFEIRLAFQFHYRYDY
jgi:hypothetical protein